MTPEEATALGELITNLTCFIPTILLLCGIPWLAIVGTYRHMGKLVKIMEEATEGARQHAQTK